MRLLVIAMILFTSGVVLAQTVTKLTASPATINLIRGHKIKLAVTETLSDGSQRAAGNQANWSSSDAQVVSVVVSANPDLNGTVTAHKVGKATVTATVNGTQVPVAVTVTNGP